MVTEPAGGAAAGHTSDASRMTETGGQKNFSIEGRAAPWERFCDGENEDEARLLRPSQEWNGVHCL